ncbi:hypothetical protein H1R20_g3506, partial [Candolleomyces eurysporus]
MPLQQGETFFQGWDFFTSPDPTHGLVDYIDEASGRRDGILEINSAGNAIMRVETTPTVPGNRKSIRITTQATFNGGLVIMDAVHMPHGCGTWPAFWTNVKWDATGIAVYFFPRDSIPADITANTPLPETWGAAQARWPAASCDPFRFFSDHHAIFDTTLCGDWAGGVWNAAGIPGQEQSCAQRTGFATCDAFIRARGSAFQEAYWEVRYVQIYEER